jgi:CheY-like chemotaxis protein
MNLLTNAAKYTPANGWITVSAATEGDTVAIRVRDDGVGLAPDMLEHIYEPFVQVDTSISRADGGLGLGLPLVKQLAELQGGTVIARSDGPDRGSEFELRLPGAAPPTPAVVDVPDPSPVAGRRRVLLVDDNRESADMLGEELAQDGHEVRVTYDGDDAVTLAREFRPEVAFVDIGLPGRDGYEVARSLRAELPNALLVAVTGFGGAQVLGRALAAGFDERLLKPVKLSTLETLLLRERGGVKAAPA